MKRSHGGNHRSALIRKARRVRVLFLDVDGVLTDGRIYYDPLGQEIKVFHVRDGMGIRFLLDNGIEVGLLSARVSKAVDRRAEELGLTLVYQGVKEKTRILETLMQERGWTPDQIAYMGDDFIDLPVMHSVGFSITVQDAPEEVRKAADYVTRSGGGNQAVREAAELILKAQRKWASVLSVYSMK